MKQETIDSIYKHIMQGINNIEDEVGVENARHIHIYVMDVDGQSKYDVGLLEDGEDFESVNVAAGKVLTIMEDQRERHIDSLQIHDNNKIVLYI